jgi:alkanesulfonate monooxygenase SsuD/methylene tetrahydromethanopterin reductase-like flavin-dependent oxidoreductase (luciferase family)
MVRQHDPAGPDAEAERLFTSLQQAVVALRSGRPGRLPPPREGFATDLDAGARAMLEHALACAVVGSPDTVRKGLHAFVSRTGADELMVTAQVFDHAARKRSFTLAAEAGRALGG